MFCGLLFIFFFSSRRRHTRSLRDWSSDVCSSDLGKPVVIEQAGTQTQGIWASPPDTLEPADVELPPCGVAGTRLHDIEVSGFTVQGFEGFGIYLACVDGFRIRGNTAQHNDTYAIFPVRSSKGRMTRNTSS